MIDWPGLHNQVLQAPRDGQGGHAARYALNWLSARLPPGGLPVVALVLRAGADLLLVFRTTCQLGKPSLTVASVLALALDELPAPPRGPGICRRGAAFPFFSALGRLGVFLTGATRANALFGNAGGDGAEPVAELILMAASNPAAA